MVQSYIKEEHILYVLAINMGLNHMLKRADSSYLLHMAFLKSRPAHARAHAIDFDLVSDQTMAGPAGMA
jgi:hypothetical protein